ncbi:MAG: 2Fe-2S iron-sulfur cluster binding domain-containing protein [Clostridiales bacterium]|nr:2Fe-2S iron-sulfur cluster binding domain-containing protein [Candidatus Crickella caballi]
MAVNVKVGPIGALDMLKFKNMAKVREQAIQAAPANEISGDFSVNKLAKEYHPDFLDLKIAEIIEHKDAKTFVFESAGQHKIPYFRAGQYLSLKLPIEGSYVTRPYSISSGPSWTKEGKIAITVKANPAGFAADWMLKNFKVGDAVTASAPEGQFFYENLRDSKNVIALAGGSGITPFLSMAYALRDGDEDFNLTILFGSKTEADILFKKELDEIAAACSKVKIVHVLSDEQKEGYENGFITAELIKKYAAEDTTIFMCGPEAMYRFVSGEIAKLELPRRRVRVEMLGVTKKVWEQDGFPAKAKDAKVKLTVKVGENTYEIEAACNEPMLVAIERAGIKAPSRCRSGECGWCRSKLVSGEIFVPEENEFRRYSDKEFGYVHPCCTFALTDAVIEVPGEFF